MPTDGPALISLRFLLATLPITEEQDRNMNRTELKIDTYIARESSAAVLIRRNLAQQSRWLNDPDPRPWATHPMQTVVGLMQWQRDCLKGA